MTTITFPTWILYALIFFAFAEAVLLVMDIVSWRNYRKQRNLEWEASNKVNTE